MAENRASAIMHSLNPLNRVREGWANFRAHPFQTLVRAGAGAAASLYGGPVAGQAASSSVGAGFNRYNTHELTDSDAQRQQDFSNRLDQQIWAPWSGGSSQGGMSGITSPYNGGGAQGQSQIAQMLGLPNYLSGQQSQSPAQSMGNSGQGSQGQYTFRGNEVGSGPADPGTGGPTMEIPSSKPGISVSDITNGTTTGGIRGPGSQAQPAPMPANNVSGISGGGARDSFTGHGGTTDIGSVMASLQGAQFATSQGMTNPSRRQDIGENAARKNIMAMLKADPNDQKALEWKQQLRDAAIGSR